MRYATLLMLCLLFVGIAVADEAPGFRIEKYTISVKPDFAKHTTSILTRIDVANPSLLNKFEFTVRKPFTAVSVKTNGAQGEGQQTGDDLTVTLKKPARRFSIEVLTQADADAKSTSENRSVVDDDSLFLIWSDAFYPTDFASWAPVETSVELPAGWEAVAPGTRFETRSTKAGTVVHSFRSKLPQTAFSIFADRRWTRSERTVHGFHMVTLLHPESQQFAEQIFKGSADVLRYFTDLHGVQPFETFSFVTIPGMYGRRAFAGFVGYPPKALEKEMTTTGYDAHETSLLWWGYTTRASGRGAWQWNEGLGDYVEFLYGESRNKPLPAIFEKYRQQYLESDWSQEPLYTELRGNTPQKFVHGKYPWVMAALRWTLGDDEAFRRGIRALFANYRFKTYTLDEFVTTFEKASGENLAEWRNQWFGRRGVPQLSVEYTIEPKDRLYRVSGTVTQLGELYTLRIPANLLHDSSLEVGSRVDIREKVTSFELFSPEKPTSLVLNKGNNLLLKVTYPSTLSHSNAQDKP